MIYDDDDYDSYKEIVNRMEKQLLPGAVEFPEVNTLGDSSRIGDTDREKAIHHILDMTAKGYLPDKEAATRVKHAASAETHAQLRNLTSDLPPYKDTRSFHDRHWLPLYLTGMALSACLGVIPTAVMSTEKVYPHQAYGVALGILTVVMGIFGFVFGIIGIAVRCNELPSAQNRYRVPSR